MNRLTEVVTPQGAVQYTYDAIGRRTSRTISGGDVTAYTYDKVNRLKSVSLRGRTVTYSYDLTGRLIEKVLPNGSKATYQYDAADRVTSIAYAKTDGAPIEGVAYTYDAGGQRIVKGLGGSSLQETPFTATYDEASRLTQITLDGESFALTYDENGNLTSKSGPVSGTTTYSWTARNQLSSISGPSGSASFRYDAMGRRIEKTVNGDTTGFLYDGAQAIAELKGSALETVYHTGLEIDEVLAKYGASGNKTLLTDALMSVIAQANDDQSIGNFYAYSPYGQAVTLGPDGGNSLQYTGRENDGTGLYYYRARYYDPLLKRFISEDPIGIAGGINAYIYVAARPVSANDPYGLRLQIRDLDPRLLLARILCKVLHQQVEVEMEKQAQELFNQNMKLIEEAYRLKVAECVEIKDPCKRAECLRKELEDVTRRRQEQWDWFLNRRTSAGSTGFDMCF